MSTLDELAARVVMGAFPGPTLPRWMKTRLEAGLGSICLFGSNVASPDQLASLTDEIHAIGPDVLTATDEEGGDVTRLHMRDGSPHPGNAALGVLDHLDVTEQVAREIGAELAAAGVDIDLAPVVDVNSNPANPVIGVRSFGADAASVGRHACAFVKGLQSSGVGACVKHFPGHGDTAVDSHLDHPIVTAPREMLRDRELAPFAAAIEAGTLAVMTSHVLLPAIDPQLPATLSAVVLNLLRDELGFDGLLISDALDMQGASAGRGEPAAAVLAIAAGCDLLCLGADKEADLHDAVGSAIVSAVRSGELDESRLAEAADRVVRAGRRVRSWRADPATGHVSPGASDRAAAGAIRATGQLPALRAAVVLTFHTNTNVAVGRVPWGLPPDGRVLTGGREIEVLPSSRGDDLLAAAAGSPLVALVREPHRNPWVAELLAWLVHARPDLVVVEMGWPGGALPPGVATVFTYGASRASSRALDELLASGAAVAEVSV